MTTSTKYSKEILEPLVRDCTSINAIAKKLGSLRHGGSSHRWIRKKIKDYNLDTSHFRGQGWSKGLTLPANHNPRYKEKNQIFKIDSPITGPKLRGYYIKENTKYVCNICEINTWNNIPLKLHLDHINGICNDNRLENLRWLCPNCHQQTETWGWTGNK